jgi:hypothetical protein
MTTNTTHITILSLFSLRSRACAAAAATAAASCSWAQDVSSAATLAPHFRSQVTRNGRIVTCVAIHDK